MLIQSQIAALWIDNLSTDQLDLVHVQHEKELRSMEARYARRLSEKDDVISHLEEQVGYLVSRRSSRKIFFHSSLFSSDDLSHRWYAMTSPVYFITLGDTDSFESDMDEDYEEDEDDEDDDEDVQSIISSIYDVWLYCYLP